MDVPERVIWWSKDGISEPDPERMTPIAARSALVNKPSGGFWTSPEGAEIGWEDWCRGEEMDWLGERWSLTVVGAPRLLVIDSRADLDAAFARWPMVHEWALGKYVDRGLDWLAIASEYDGAWLTTNGYLETRHLHMDGRFDGPSTSAWDCESIVWFRWSFGAVERSPVLIPQT